MLFGCFLLALGCGSNDEGASPKLQGELRNSRLGYSVRFPDGWRAVKGEQANGARALQGPGGRECVVGPVVGLPDWSSEAGRRSYYEHLARERKLDLRSGGPAKAASGEGYTTVTAATGRLVRSTTVASGGVGVSLICSAPEDAFEKADEEVFRPMVSSVKVPRDERADELQSRVVSLNGVTAAGIVLSGDRAQAQLRLARRDAGLPAVKQALRLLVEGGGADRVRVHAFKDPVNPVIGNWDVRTGRAFVQAIPNPPERYTLQD